MSGASDAAASTGRAVSETAQLVELRVTLANITSEVHRLRSDLGPVAALPVQLDAITQLWQERLDNAVKERTRDVQDLRTDVDELRSWQTWLTRLVVGAVVAAVLALVVSTGPVTVP